jgi:hypothetical protein
MMAIVGLQITAVALKDGMDLSKTWSRLVSGFYNRKNPGHKKKVGSYMLCPEFSASAAFLGHNNVQQKG